MIDWTKPIQCTDGRAARLIADMPQPSQYSRIVCVAEYDGRFLTVSGVRDDGRPFDLRNVEPEVKQYQNQYDNNDIRGLWRNTFQSACEAANNPVGVPAPLGIIERTLNGGKLVGVRIVPESEWRASS